MSHSPKRFSSHLFPIPLAVLGGVKGIAVSVVYTLSVQTKGSE